jgi:hypothetical protein
VGGAVVSKTTSAAGLSLSPHECCARRLSRSFYGGLRSACHPLRSIEYLFAATNPSEGVTTAATREPRTTITGNAAFLPLQAIYYPVAESSRPPVQVYSHRHRERTLSVASTVPST